MTYTPRCPNDGAMLKEALRGIWEPECWIECPICDYAEYLF